MEEPEKPASILPPLVTHERSRYEEIINKFMKITGVSEATAIQKLEKYNRFHCLTAILNDALYAYFNEGDRNVELKDDNSTKGQSVTRKLKSAGHVDTMHDLSEGSENCTHSGWTQ